MGLRTGQSKTIIADKESNTTATVEDVGNGKGAILTKSSKNIGPTEVDLLKDILVELKVLNTYLAYGYEFDVPRESFEREV